MLVKIDRNKYLNFDFVVSITQQQNDIIATLINNTSVVIKTMDDINEVELEVIRFVKEANDVRMRMVK